MAALLESLLFYLQGLDIRVHRHDLCRQESIPSHVVEFADSRHYLVKIDPVPCKALLKGFKRLYLLQRRFLFLKCLPCYLVGLLLALCSLCIASCLLFRCCPSCESGKPSFLEKSTTSLRSLAKC